MSSAYGYPPPRRRPLSHHQAGTISAAIGYRSARATMAFPWNCGRSGRATANTSSATSAL